MVDTEYSQTLPNLAAENEALKLQVDKLRQALNDVSARERAAILREDAAQRELRAAQIEMKQARSPVRHDGSTASDWLRGASAAFALLASVLEGTETTSVIVHAQPPVDTKAVEEDSKTLEHELLRGIQSMLANMNKGVPR